MALIVFITRTLLLNPSSRLIRGNVQFNQAQGGTITIPLNYCDFIKVYESFVRSIPYAIPTDRAVLTPTSRLCYKRNGKDRDIAEILLITAHNNIHHCQGWA